MMGILFKGENTINGLSVVSEIDFLDVAITGITYSSPLTSRHSHVISFPSAYCLAGLKNFN